MAKVNPIPTGYEAATPYLICKDAARALEFYRDAFRAVEAMRMPMPDGKIGHAEFRIGGALVMLADEFPDMGALGPQTIGGSPVTIHIYVEDVDAVCDRAVKAGAKVLQPLQDQFYGDRSFKMADPFGHLWMFASRKEDLSAEEMQKRSAALFGTK